MKKFLFFRLKKNVSKVLIAWGLLVLSSPLALAAGPDHFGSAQRLESKHFIIEYKDDVDVSRLGTHLHISSIDQQLTNLAVDHASVANQLPSMVEILFARASAILDMRVDSLKTHIKIFATHQQLVDFFHTMYPGALPCMGLSFYVPDYDAIYISAPSFRREIVGHEIAHAIMSHYFVVQPPVKIQEVLAGYVEYQLRKTKQ